MTAYYSTPAGLPISLVSLKDVLYVALRQLIAIHPVLSAIVIDEDTTETAFVRLPVVDLDAAVMFITRQRAWDISQPDKELETLLGRQHDEGFVTAGRPAGTAPFWRAVVITEDKETLDKFAVAFVYHHSLADGSSGLAFHRALRTALPANPGAIAVPMESKISPPLSPLLPATETMLNIGFTPMALLKVLWRVYTGWNAPKERWTGGNYNLSGSTAVRIVSIPAATLAKMRARCKEEKTTVTALLQVVIVSALLNSVGPEHTEIALTGAMSVRQFLPEEINNDAIGCWATGFTEIYSKTSLTKTGLWETARQNREHIQALVDARANGTLIGLLGYFHDYKKVLTDRIGKRRSDSVELSNVGVFDAGGEVGDWRIDKVVFTQSPNAVGPALQWSGVSLKGGDMVLGATWQSSVIEEELAERTIAAVVRGIEEIVDA